MDEIFMCEYIGCNRYFDKPVLLPCGNSICQEHVQKMKMLNCQFCGDLHVVPKSGFELNKNFIDIMNLNLHLNESQKAVKYSLKLLENVVEEFHTITHSLEAYLFEYIIAIKNKINMEMQNLREDSGFFEQEMISLIREYDNECKNNLISLKNLNDLNNLEYENLKSDLNQFYQELRAPKLDKRRLNELLIEVNDKIKEYQMIIKNYKTDIINNTIESNGTSDDPSFPISVVSQFNFKFSENFGEMVQSLHGHTEGVRDVKLWTNDRIISASSDRSIKIWNAFTGECVGTLLGHKNAVICIQLLSNNRLVSGSWDSTIKIWDLNKQKCLLTLKGHKSFISCLCLFRNDLLISGSGDSTIKIWDLKSLKCVKTLRGHTDSINSIKVIAAQNKLISGSNDSTIKIWDLSSSSPNEFKLLRNIKDHNGAVNCLEILSTDEFISGSSDNTIRIWNVNTAKCKTTLQDVSAIWSLKLINGNLLVSGNQNIYKNIKLWDLDKKYELDEIKGHSKYVIGFEVMSNGNLVSCSGDKSIKIWQL